MANTEVKTVLEETKEKLDGYIQDYNKALLNKDLAAKNEAEQNIKGAVKDYKKQKFDSVLYHLKQQENPLMAAIQQLTYTVLRAKSVKEDGVETGMELVDSDARIDLVRVCEYCNISTVWKYKVEKLGLLLALRAAKEIGTPASELTKMTRDYRMTDLARKEEMGETPASNTQITKMIQTIMDEILPGLEPLTLPDGKTKARKANSHDAAYMWIASTRAGREAKTIKVVDGRLAHNLFADVANRIVTDGRYTAEYKRVRNSDSEKTPEQPATAAPAAETPEQPAA